ncbi:hypothetical protein COW83_00445 [Candidatus Collierbacteria bacterium CG22_combo_CG10-13_8_21_14_all_43_12]|uniref:Uncharacterized protein n=1 Tax=Candidatus Collierbacteria bacterium CG22_combo_CG10-13_8_21_14_all_43_12 TaxID=1974537 RepID=A0A2H0DVD7_9BACT|nr:hypothetical protein [bacterium]PIP86144.1 MAG: hypothetical protein COW83_00445 [Candidatus Collierbacteria bacterium CG22_combo_CG10-13_8_21_14_all_43_12]
MESPYTDRIHKLQKIARISALVTLVLIALTVGLSFLPGAFVIIPYFMAPIAAIISIGAAFEAAMWQQAEVKWHLDQTLDRLAQMSKASHSDLDENDD